MSWIITNQLPDYLAEVQPRRAAELAKTRQLVIKRLEGNATGCFSTPPLPPKKNTPAKNPKNPQKA